MQAFLVNLGRFRRYAAGLSASHLGPVRLVYRECDEPPFVEYRNDDHNVRKMRPAAAIGAVGDEGVAFGDVSRFRVVVQQVLNGRIQRGQKGGDPVSLGQEIAPRIRGAHGEVGGFVDDGAHAGADDRLEHFVAQRNDAVLDDLPIE